MHGPRPQTWSEKQFEPVQNNFGVQRCFRHIKWQGIKLEKILVAVAIFWVFGTGIFFSLYKALSYWTKQVIDGTFERMFIIIARLHTNNYKHRNIHNNENFIGASGLLTLLFPIIAASSLSARLGSLAKASNKWFWLGLWKSLLFVKLILSAY